MAAKNAFMKKVRPSAALARIVGSDPLPRTSVVKKLWDYIKRHDLQDPRDRRTIVCDATLGAALGGCKRVSMFEMNRLLSHQLS